MAKKPQNEASLLKEVLNAVNTVRHYDCDAATVSNRIYNVMIDQWSAIVPEMVERMNEELLDGKLSKKSRAELQTKLLDRLFQKGKMNVIFQKFLSQKLEKMMILPRSFVLEEDRENADFGRDKDEETEEMLLNKNILAARERILEKRYQLQALDQLLAHVQQTEENADASMEQ
ncbi:hypothetical protein M3Y99_00089500 [Aphelenchoides fujianensis]|nr:hypothetical protein M3Y99_00089500 [Aphelenchoides fujianensis]